MRREGLLPGCTVLVCAAAALVGLVSCGPPAITGDFDSPQPAARIFATRRVAASSDPAQICEAMPGLIQNLESDDPAVRLLSAAALEELTGQTFGYRYYDPSWMREPAVKRWRDAWLDGEITLRNGTPLEPNGSASHAAVGGSTLGR